ncbi:hypothetical protein A176_005944 [Myxococcus hansupus]|uniref:Uncharacterized protein n=1 Tax=Pseudomyxococcus hansupus TaxID=1297742 RepID=A0A0H4XLA6_9BACT|nr:hypothetical protein A176_005944 [Myxococcus hansupus]
MRVGRPSRVDGGHPGGRGTMDNPRGTRHARYDSRTCG